MTNSTEIKLNIGIVGCGNISVAYLKNAPLFKGVHMYACADLNSEAAKKRAAEFKLQAMDVDTMMADPKVDLVLNLTVPNAHFDISMQALDSGKHVYTEKPLATNTHEGKKLIAEAASRSLAIGSAPDTLLGAAGRQARRLIENGSVGKPITGTAFMMGRGMEHVHPDPAFYYQPGAGPILDMGPYYLTMMVNLLGPIMRVQSVANKGHSERLITADGPKKNTTFPVGTPTNILSLLEFSSGVTITFGASWDVYRHSNSHIELHGTHGSIRLPDPDTFGGIVALSDHGAEWEEIDTSRSLFGKMNWPGDAPDRANYRMLGLADLAHNLVEGRPPRASGELAFHVLEVMEAILTAAETGTPQSISSNVAKPEALSEAEAQNLLLDFT